MKIGGILFILLCCMLLGASAQAAHFTPPSATNFWETIWGYITGFDTLDAGDELAAFRVDNGQLAGTTTISFDGSNYGYNMVAFAPDITPYQVYFLVWDGTEELDAGPQLLSQPGEFGAGPTQHDLNSVPEPPTVIIMALSLFVVFLVGARVKFAVSEVERRKL